MKLQDKERFKKIYTFAKDISTISEGITLERFRPLYKSNRQPDNTYNLKIFSFTFTLCVAFAYIFLTERGVPKYGAITHDKIISCREGEGRHTWIWQFCTAMIQRTNHLIWILKGANV